MGKKISLGSPIPLADAQEWVISKLIDFSPDLICISLNTANYENGLRLLKCVREMAPDKLLLVGGPHISTSWPTFCQLHSDLFDIGVIGEGEVTILEICQCVRENHTFENIAGCVLAKDKQLKYSPRAQISHLDALPYPDREGFINVFSGEEVNLVEEHYNRVFYSSLPGFRNKNHARIVASRGCNYSCSFCSPSIYWRNP